MKILVCSDSHHATDVLKNIILENDDADLFVFLGDGAYDLACLREDPEVTLPRTIQVCGNCDRPGDLATSSIDNIDGYRFFSTHGHAYYVKSGLEHLALMAREAGCDAALYGHTHRAFQGEKLGVKLFNPGAVCNGCYGTVVTDGDGIHFYNWQVNFE